jgi:hypothetical protein
MEFMHEEKLLSQFEQDSVCQQIMCKILHALLWKVKQKARQKRERKKTANM